MIYLFMIFLGGCLLSSHPFLMTVFILLMSASLGILGGELMCKWLFISIFMVFIGGMMILFFYLISLSSVVLISEISFLRCGFLLLFVFLFNPFFKMAEMSDNKSLFSVYNSCSSQVLVFLTLILIISLVSASKLSQNFKGSMSGKW